MQNRLNNKGMTLLELIISMAIAVIVVVMIVSFMNGAFRVFQKTSDEVNLQMEAQTAVNQLSDITMEAKEIQISSDGNKYLVSYNITGKKDYVIIFDPVNYKLYLKEIDVADKASPTESNLVTMENLTYGEGAKHYSDEENLQAEYVHDFSIEDPDTKLITITMELQIGDNNSYKIDKKVNLRNYVSPTP